MKEVMVKSFSNFPDRLPASFMASTGSFADEIWSRQVKVKWFFKNFF